MRWGFSYIIWLLLSLVSGSCGVKRYLPPGEKLYYGASIKIKKAPEVKTKTTALQSRLAPLAVPKRNKQLLGKPYKVWWWYVIGESKKEKGFKVWLRNTLGDPPVLSQDLNPLLNAQNMQALLENEGYFNSQVGMDTSINKYKIKV